MATEFEYQQQKEILEGGIREAKLTGYQADLDRERLVAQRKQTEVTIAQEDLTQVGIRLNIAQEKTGQLRLKLQQAQVETQVFQVELGMTLDRYSGILEEREIQFSLLTQKLRGLDLRLAEQKQENDHYRTNLNDRGFTELPLNFDLRRILEEAG